MIPDCSHCSPVRRRTLVLFPMMLFMLFCVSIPPSTAGDLILNSVATFASLDNSAVDEDATLGVLKLNSLTINNGGGITCYANNTSYTIKVTTDLIIYYNGYITTIGQGNSLTVDVNGLLFIGGTGEISSYDNTVAGSDASPILISAGTLTMEPGGAIRAENIHTGGNGGNVTISVGGNMQMQGTGSSGAVVSGEKTAGAGDTGDSGDITVSVGGTLEMQSGSHISNDCTGPCGFINIYASQVTVGGTVSARSAMTTGARAAGGFISISAGSLLGDAMFIESTGHVVSSGINPGADLVHIEACHANARIYGLVESTAAGNIPPTNPPNHLDGTYRPGKPANSTAGVEIWAAGYVTIDGNAFSGSVNADVGFSAGSTGRGWIDIIAIGNINLDAKPTGSIYMMHANMGLTNGHGGLITVKSIEGTVTVSGKAIQASCTNSGSKGGEIIIQANSNVTLDNADLQADGDYGPMGGLGWGGSIDARSFNGTLSWTNGVGDVRPTGTSIPGSQQGWINLTHCSSNPIDLTGTSFPASGAFAPTTSTGVCGGKPGFAYASTCGPLPVELTAFTALLRNETVVLTWRTATEANNYGFEVQKSYDRNAWHPIGFVLGAGTSNTPHNYAASDQLDAGDRRASRIYYRLMQIDRDGSMEYSSVVSVAPAMLPAKPTLFQNHPNPFNPETNISFTLDESQSVSLIVYDTYGRIVRRMYDGAMLDAGYHAVAFSGSDLPSGAYRYQLRTRAGVLSRTMVLSK